MYYRRVKHTRSPISLYTWRNRGKFRYYGSVSQGTDIEYGIDFAHKASVSAAEYRAILKHFSGREVPIGTSRDNRPPNSLGEWLAGITGAAIASYVGPILVKEDYANPGSKSDLIRFN